MAGKNNPKYNTTGLQKNKTMIQSLSIQDTVFVFKAPGINVIRGPWKIDIGADILFDNNKNIRYPKITTDYCLLKSGHLVTDQNGEPKDIIGDITRNKNSLFILHEPHKYISQDKMGRFLRCVQTNNTSQFVIHSNLITIYNARGHNLKEIKTCQ